jgi:hypothetical protein
MAGANACVDIAAGREATKRVSGDPPYLPDTASMNAETMSVLLCDRVRRFDEQMPIDHGGRSKELRELVVPSRCANRAPARLARARPTCSHACRSGGVASRVPAREPIDLLRERPRPAVVVLASEPPCLDLDLHSSTAQSHV